jgi:surface polysaccharide O-acyltransferase-like enzyme
MFFNTLVQCADVTIPDAIVNVVRTIYTLIKVAVPLLLILFGMLDLGKAVISQKEDDIKKQQNVFVKRLIAAALVFFVFAIAQLLVNLVDKGDAWSCVSDIIGKG